MNAIRGFATAAANGTATPTQAAAVAAIVGPGGYNLPDAGSAVSKLVSDNAVAGLLNSATPGSSTIPSGGNVPIMVVSGLPADSIVPLGNGGVMIGTGGATDGCLLGTGDVAEVAGLPIAIRPPSWIHKVSR